MAIADESGEVKVISFETGRIVGIGAGHGASCGSVVVSPDSKLVVSGDASGGIFIWNLY